MMNESISRAEALEHLMRTSQPWFVIGAALLCAAIIGFRRTRLRLPTHLAAATLIVAQVALAGAAHLQRQSADQDFYYEASFALTFGPPADRELVCANLALEQDRLVSEIQETCRPVEMGPQENKAIWI